MATKQPIYLDYNATTPVRPEAIAAINEALALSGNPSSSHAEGRAARALMEKARRQVAQAVHADPAELVFTSGGTEANGAALTGTGSRYLVVSATEHDSIISGAPATGLPVKIIPVDGNGLADLQVLEDILSQEGPGGLVSVMLANNETGIIQPITDIAAIAHTHGALVHCDAVQALGKIPVDFAALGVDYLSVSAHKIGGPKGVGALVVKAGRDISPLVTGGGQEKGRRSGTENLPGIAGFGAAADMVPGSIAQMQDLVGLRDDMEDRIMAACPDAVIFGKNAPRLPNTSNLSMPGATNELQLMTFDLAGLCVSAGSACSSGKISSSHVLTAMGVDLLVGANAIRVSLGWGTTAGDVDHLVDAWVDLYQRQAAKGGC